MTFMNRLPVPLIGVVFIAVLGLPAGVTAQDELLSAPPEERSTPESIRFAPVDEEQLGNTSIEGALGPSAAGLVSQDEDTLVEPVYLSDQLRRSLDLEQDELQRQREQLIGPSRNVSTPPTQVQFPAYQNRTYSPSSSSSSTFRD
ncbi:hypothetical protein DES49_0066 [Halospina denitrificans]|uniref:Uncharacterized protein n=1 Tax=Halospina denitrificans TaxID=332522 RepID=A0A4R7K1R9_9GAMM|nr:hypothetical protein [Halospina denitrificans]TDT43967.1 hypothetical protein DES49_0066 [Halospina denitrificans]